ncbi:MAG: RsmB/NOP family class I SAM-dependent RNA methyltransferase [Caulobacteraceae bacterium]
MTPAARIAAAIEVLDEIARHRTPADTTLKAWGKGHRFAGSKDRRAIAERVYAVLRARGRLAWIMGADSGRDLVLASLVHQDGLEPSEVAELFTGEGYGAQPLTEDEIVQVSSPSVDPPEWVKAGLPEFVATAFKAQFGSEWMAEAHALIGGRAPLDLRVNTLRGGVHQAMTLLETDDLKAARTPISALGLRLSHELAPDVQRLRAFKSGWVEVQDEASQIAAALADAKPGMVVVDYCAGGGGKTLALGAAMRALRPPRVVVAEGDIPLEDEERPIVEETTGRLIASDVNPKRLEAMAPRLARADIVADVRQIGPEGQGMEDLIGLADLVFVDAPCSGTGTWRRHPEAAWKLQPATVVRLSILQRQIVARAAKLVKPGGRLAYATCSVLTEENEAVAAHFANAHPEFRPLPIVEAAKTSAITDAGREKLAALVGQSSADLSHTLQMTPHRTGTDGFFIALFEKTA